MAITPTCVEALSCKPDLSNPLQWLEVFGRAIGLPAEFGISLLMLIIIGALYLRTQNIIIASIAVVLVVTYMATSSFTQLTHTSIVVIVIAVSAVLVLLVYKLKAELF